MPAASTGRPTGRLRTTSDHAWEAAAALAVVVTGMAYSLWVGPAILRAQGWVTPGDIWITLRAAHVIAWGGEGILYQHSAGYITLPGVALVLAPVAMVSSALHLSEAFPFTVMHPSAWLLLGPAEMALGSSVLFALGTVGRRLGLTRGRRRVLLVVESAVIWPAVALWGHPEDLLALGFALWAVVAALDARWLGAAVLISLSLVFQPLTVVILPLLAVYTPVRRWLHGAAIAALPSAVLLVAPLVQTWRTTVHNLVDQPTFPTVTHATPWVALAPVLQPPRTVRTGMVHTSPSGSIVYTHVLTHVPAAVAGGPSRIFALVGAVALALVARRRRTSEEAAVWLAGAALALRCLFEAVTIEYYLIPALAVGVLVAAHMSWRRLALGACGAGAATYLAYLHLGPWPYFLVVGAALVTVVVVGAPLRRPRGSPASAPTAELAAVAVESAEASHRRGLAPV